MLVFRSGFWSCLVLLLVFFHSAGDAAAEGSETATALCDRAIVRGSARAGIPTMVLNAISLTETGRMLGGRFRPWPWAINREGKGHWFASRDAALAFAKASLAEGRTSFDIGCFQINYRWHGDRFPSLEAMFDQDQGAEYAARFLRDLHSELGTWSAAAGAYHSRTPHYAGIYRARFDRILANLGDAPLVVAALEPEPPEVGAPPRKSRTRMARGPLIITIDPRSGKPRPDRVDPPEPEVSAGIGPRRLTHGGASRVAAAEAAF